MTAYASTRTMRRPVLAATSISYLLVLLDTSVVNVGLDRIAVDLGSGIAGLQWVVSAYTLAFASLLLTGGTLGDRLGPRNVYGAGLALFTLASAGCGLAAGLPALVAARVAQGAGAALLVPCSLKLIDRACPEPRERARAIGLWIACGGAAMAAGPLVGGALIQAYGWRAIFFVNLPIGLAGLGLVARLPRDAVTAGAGRFDPAGQASGILALGGSIAVLIEGRPLGWTSPAILAAIVLTGVAWMLFLAVEARGRAPMLPLGFFRNGIFTGSTVVSAASAFVFYGLLFAIGLYYQQVCGYSPLATGAALIPMTAMVAAGSLLSNRMSALWGLRRTMAGAFAGYAAGALGLWPAGPGTPYWQAVPSLVAIGLAAGYISPAATAPAMGTVAKHRTGVAGAVLNAARQSGTALGVAIFGSTLAALASFETGFHAVLAIAAAVSLLAAGIWWRALKP